MHKCNFTGRFTLVQGKLWLVQKAHYKGSSLDVLKTCEDGRQRSRNLYFRSIFGYGVTFPGDRENMGYGYGYAHSVLEPWGDCLMNVDPALFEYDHANEKDRAVILAKYPDFRWIMAKHPELTRAEILALIPLWLKDHKVELLLDAGFKSMAFNKTFYRLTGTRRHAVLDFLRHNPGRNWTLTEVQTIMAEGIGLEEYRLYSNFCCMAGKRVSYRVYKYLEHHPDRYNDVYLYHDYARMAKRCGHNMKDPYWAYPKNLRAAHNKVMEEMDRILEDEKKEQVARKQAAYMKAVKKWISKAVDMNGVKVYVPETTEDIREQATALHQCLITCDYIQKVINKKCLLVFIVRGTKRMATAEILPDGTVGQFYGNEKNRNSCHPSKTAREALEQWKETFITKKAA